MLASLQEHFERWVAADAARRPVASTVLALADGLLAARRRLVRGDLSLPPAGASFAAPISEPDAASLAGDVDGGLGAALATAPVAAYTCAQSERAQPINAGAPLAVAAHALVGAADLDANLPTGTLFSILPMPTPVPDDLDAVFLRPGTVQQAAGLVLYGAQTVLALSLGRGTLLFTADPAGDAFLLTRDAMSIPVGRREVAIDVSGHRHWDDAVRAYVDDCLDGTGGPRDGNFTLRWTGSLVAEAYWTLVRGGVLICPRDVRPGHERGRLRLVHEAAPLALLVEQAGGACTDGLCRLLEMVPTQLHQRVPLVLGSQDKVDRVAAYLRGELPAHERSPLFGRRGLYRD